MSAFQITSLDQVVQFRVSSDNRETSGWKVFISFLYILYFSWLGTFALGFEEAWTIIEIVSRRWN